MTTEIFEKMLKEIPNPGIDFGLGFERLVEYGVIERDEEGKTVPTRKFMACLYMFGQPGQSLFIDPSKLSPEEREEDDAWRIRQGIYHALDAFLDGRSISDEAYRFVCSIVKELCDKLMDDGYTPNDVWYPRRFTNEMNEQFNLHSEVFVDKFKDHCEAKRIRGYDVSAQTYTEAKAKAKNRKLTK